MNKNLIKILVIISIISVQSFAIKESDIMSQMTIKIDKTTNLLQNKKIKLQNKSDQIFETFDSIFDYVSMSKIALGRQWGKLTIEQKKSFTETFTLSLKRSYIDKLNLYTDQKISIDKIEKIKNNRIKLYTKVIGHEESYDVIYKFHKSKKDDNWLIYDVNMVGVSLMKTYRSQFKEYLSSNSYDNLLITLKTKNKK